MSGRVTVRTQVVSAIKSRLDQELGVKAALIEVKSKARVPLDKGGLQSSGRHKRRGFCKFRVEFDKEYAEYQERGERADGSRKVRHYTTPGTGKQYLESSAAEVVGAPFGRVTT